MGSDYAKESTNSIIFLSGFLLNVAQTFLKVAESNRIFIFSLDQYFYSVFPMIDFSGTFMVVFACLSLFKS